MKGAHYILLLTVFTAASALAADPDDFTFFESEIRPLLVEHCYECHSAGAKKLRGNLHLDSRPGWSTGGDSGPALVPGNPTESLLLHAIRYGDEDLEMPPKRKLPPAAIRAFEKWIAMGAPDPRETLRSPKGEERATIDLEAGRRHWSFRPLTKPQVPEVRDETWPRNPIDRFILARLEAANLPPAPDADPATLHRRLHIDLTGLPPSAGRVATFSNSEAAKLAGELLASREFAQRFARHWLDLARYADSTGGGASNLLPDAYKYRDWVVRAFENDLPFDRFLTLQLAGDLLPAAKPEERAQHLLATAFLVLGPRNYINDDEETFHMDGADEQLDTVGRVFLGMTLGCARCHDHKFDPVPMDDYYALAGIFTSTETSDPIPATTNFEWNDVADPRVDPDGSQLRAWEKAYARYRTLTRKWSKARTDSNFTPAQVKAFDEERKAAKEEIPPKPPTFIGLTDHPEPSDETLRIRGNPHKPSKEIPRGFLRVTLPPGAAPPKIPANQSGRRELAAWITSPENPLTARVYVNRIWTHLMGRGLVPTVDNFGITGEPPSHPELLDWLATFFLENGQSTRKLAALIASSHTYQLGPAPADSRLLTGDPSNHLFGRRTRRSLDAETLRDSILSISGSLELESTGEAFPAKLKNEFTYNFDNDSRRSLYLPRFRNNLPELFETFDVANPATVVGARDLTILSPQALYLMNSPFILTQSEITARRLLALNLPLTETITHAFQSTLARPPSPQELQLATNFLHSPPPADERETTDHLQRWTAFQQNLFSTVDFRFYR